MKKLLSVTIVEAVIIIWLSFMVFTQLLGIEFSKKEILQNCQPETIKYDDSDPYEPYCVWLYKTSGFLDNEYYLWVALKKDPTGYGYGIWYLDQYVDYDDNLKDLKIVWNSDSLDVYQYGTDTKISIPAQEFTSRR
ncbi:MAG: hypothetical protein WCJ58_06525 [bacterium]